jgi:hypothetical protein
VVDDDDFAAHIAQARAALEAAEQAHYERLPESPLGM